MTIPFIIHALPRSRTAWLSAFLSYKEWECYHESAMFMRSIGDLQAFLTSGNVGCVETAAMHGRPLIKHIVPNIKEVVILRPVDDVIDSLLALDLSGIAAYDRDVLKRNMEYGDRALRKIANRPDVLAVNYKDLDSEETCAKIFERCLPYDFDKKWWESFKDKNIQVDIKACFRYYHKNRKAIDNFKKICKLELSKLCRSGKIKEVKYA